MKNIYGLLLAIGLGVAGGMFNWAYLAGKARTQETESFIAIAPGADVERGKRFEAGQLVELQIPRLAVGNLDQFAVRWSAKGSVIGERAARFIKSGSLLFRQDLDTTPQQIRLAQDERIIWIPVDTRTFVPSLVMPGDQVWFVIAQGAPPPRSILKEGPPAEEAVDTEEPPSPAPSLPADSLRTIGPFTVRSLGNRLGSSEVMRSAKIAQTQENVLGIGVTVDAKGNLPADVKNLVELLASNHFQPLGVMWRSQRDKGE